MEKSPFSPLSSKFWALYFRFLFFKVPPAKGLATGLFPLAFWHRFPWILYYCQARSQGGGGPGPPPARPKVKILKVKGGKFSLF